MPIGPSDFKDLLEAYFLIKNAPDKGDKKDKLDGVKMEIYDSYLNEDFERNSNVSATESKVMKEFFMEADKFEKKYMESAQITQSEIAKESNGHALACSIEFTQHLEPERRRVLLKHEINGQLSRASKKKKSKKRKTKKRRRKSKRVKSKKVKTKRKSKSQKGGFFGLDLAAALFYAVGTGLGWDAFKSGLENEDELQKNAGKYISILSKISLDDQLKKLKDLKKQKVVLEGRSSTAEPEVQEGIPPTRSSIQGNPELNEIDREILRIQTHVFQLIMALQTKERVIAILKNIEPQIFTIEDTISDSELNTLLSEYIDSRELSGVIDFYDRIIEYVFNTLDIGNLDAIFREETEAYKKMGRSLDITKLLSEWSVDVGKIHGLKEKYGDETTRNIVKLLAILESPDLPPTQRREAINYLVARPRFEIPEPGPGETPLISHALYQEI